MTKVPYTEEQIAEAFELMKDKMGRFRTQSLFWEMRIPDYPPFFTVKKHDHEGCISLHRMYLQIADPTEYQVAMRLFGSWDHWKALQGSKWFRDLLEEMRAELKLKMESDRYWEMRQLIDHMPTSPQAVQATKWLAQRYGDTRPKVTKRGRPSKEEVAANLKDELREQEALKKDAERIGL